MKDYFYYHDPTESNHSSECRLDTEILEKVKVGLIQNLYSIIENGSAALNALVNVANASESPRAYEVVSHLMKTLTDANKDLLEIQGKVKKLKEETPNNQNASVTNNSLFIGSTMELQQLLLDPTNTNQPKDITEK